MTLADPGPGEASAQDVAHAPPTWRCHAVSNDDRARIVAEGELDLAVVPALDDLARKLAIAPGTTLQVDLTQVGFIDSSIVAFLLRLRERTQRDSARLEIAVRPAGAVRRTLDACGASGILNLV